MLSLHTNNAALSAQSSIGRTQGGLSTSMTRLSTGFRINSAMDDAAGLQIATRLKSQTSGMAVAMRNTQNATSMIQTAGGALAEIKNMLIRMKDLATQAADGASSTEDVTALKAEFDDLKKEIANVVDNTTFGGTALLKTTGFAAKVTFQIGATTAEQMEVDVGTNVGKIGTDSAALAITNQTDANTTIDKVQAVIDTVSTVDSALGGAANRLQHVYNNLSNISSNTKAAIGRIMDTDFATESANMTKNQMLTQAGTAMLKQSNQMSQMVMSLLQ
ncbi:flagellin N-terminal helical domain-containing protein [Massilia sp. GCM10023247]|uniref:flagellin N-terminal helical domain-containing protein n=1 Tax=Massilia sp. GCM10023247 TaxID=3252643 RepID=UPI00360AE6EF